MSDLAIAITIDGPAGLTLSEANGFLQMTLGPGARTWRVNSETSPFVHDEEEISRTLGPGMVPFQTLIIGNSGSQLATRMAAVLAAVEQRTYTLTAVIDGVTWAWACRGAMTSQFADGGLDARQIAEHQQVFTAQIPRHPIALSGPM